MDDDIAREVARQAKLRETLDDAGERHGLPVPHDNLRLPAAGSTGRPRPATTARLLEVYHVTPCAETFRHSFCSRSMHAAMRAAIRASALPWNATFWTAN
jgi:hypothetical protein